MPYVTKERKFYPISVSYAKLEHILRCAIALFIHWLLWKVSFSRSPCRQNLSHLIKTFCIYKPVHFCNICASNASHWTCPSRQIKAQKMSCTRGSRFGEIFILQLIDKIFIYKREVLTFIRALELEVWFHVLEINIKFAFCSQLGLI